MKITLSKSAGFCPGVKRADEKIRELIKRGGKIFTLGELIHNRIYTDELKSLGVFSVDIDEFEKIVALHTGEKITLVIRTHGVTKETLSRLEKTAEENPSVTICDLTCPYVKRIHKIADDTTNENTAFYLFCNKEHPEAIGIMSYAHGDKHMICSLEELKSIDTKGKIAILCSQTTQNLLEFEQIKKFFKKVCTKTIFYDTICSVTENRQNDAIALAKQNDAMIVIGGKHSSNTEKLFDLCSMNCKHTFWIESASDLTDFPDNAKCVGITAGASTPDSIITEVLDIMEEKNINFAEMVEASIKTLHTGETVTGTVYSISENEIALDLGAKVTGVLKREQITDDQNAKLSDMFKIGDEVDVFVIRVQDTLGIADVSKKRVDKDNNWILIKEAYDNAEIIEGEVVSVVKGGVIVSAKSNTVFVPASQTGVAKGGDLAALVGTTQKIKLIDFDAAKKKALGSIKVVLNEEKRAKEDAIWATLEVGKHYMGTVKNLTAYGAFVDIGGVDGMVHNTELSWKRIKHPSQIVSVGQQIDVFIKELDSEKRRISLGYKTQEMDSWFQFTQKFSVGDIVPAKIVSLMPFGAFAEVYEDVDGLIHISRISTQRINSPAEVLKVGDVVDVKITEIDDENRKLALSIRAITEAAERAAREEARAKEKAEREAEAAAEAERIAQERADMAPYIVGSI